MSKFSKFIDKITGKISKGVDKMLEGLGIEKPRGMNELFPTDNPASQLENYITENNDKSLGELMGNELSTPLEKDLKEIGTETAEEIKDTTDYIGLTTPEDNGIKDTTGQNEEIPIGENFNIDAYKELRNEQWQREDQIRAETQAREDTAWQRSIEDLRKSGANINLMNVQPAASGGGITSATGIDTSAGQLDLDKYLTELEGILDRELKADENTKDRIGDLISSIIFAGAMLLK